MNRPPSLPLLLTPLLLFLGGFAVSWIYQTPPALGDDLNYWGLAFDLHHDAEGAWNAKSFHDLRWPVWGLCWLLQIPLGFSALSYYAQPMIYLGAGAVVVWTLAREIGVSDRTALVAGILFLFHPQLDTVIDRPMPDLSEGFWVAVAFLAWLKMVRCPRAGRKVAFAAVVGLALAVGQANRITGVFAIPVLLVATLALYPRQLPWLALGGGFALGFVGIEAAIYHSLTGDWLHNLHANLGARGRKGTEAIPLWELPFRFLPTLFRRPIDIGFTSAALVGMVLAWTRLGLAGRALVLYAVGYILTYSCALQGISPPRPLVRDGERFLGSLAFPLSILCAYALATGATWLRARATTRRPHHAEFAAAVLILLLALTLLSKRPFRGENYLDALSVYLGSVPGGSRVLSHDAMRHIAHLANPAAAARVNWTLRKDLLDPSPETLALAEGTDEIWFNRKWIWTSSRKQSEYSRLDAIGDIAPWLRPPLAGWSARLAVAKGDVPDFVFLHHRTDSRPLEEHAPDGNLLRDLLVPGLSVPHTWTFATPPREPLELPAVAIPPHLAGRTLFLALRYSANTTEPVRAAVTFSRGDTRLQFLTFKPYFFPASSEDFFFVTIPPGADRLNIRVRLSEKTRRLTLDSFRLFSEPAPAK